MSERTAVIFSLLAILTSLLAGCGSGGGAVSENRSNRGYNPGVGPFDSSGNYVERWANDKSKGRWWRSSTTSRSKAVASKPKRKPKTKPITKPAPIPTPPVIASNPTPIPRPVSRPTTRPTPPVGRPASRPTPRPKPTVASKPKPKPKPRATKTVKVKPKRKPPIRHTVKQGDTLWALSQKYNTSVTNIQRANGLKGTSLKIGRQLLIPRY